MSVPHCFSFSDLDSFPALSPPAKLAVIGDPIAHSKSPQMHNPALRHCGIDAQYVRVQVPVGSVGEALRKFAKAGFIGINVTIPHKFEALDAVDEVDPLARTLGAVNTVQVKDGRLLGYNSDGPGFLAAVDEAFGVSVSSLRVAILGAFGGAGNAVAMQCAIEGCQKLVLVNRSVSRQLEVAANLAEYAPSIKPTFLIGADWNGARIAAELNEVDLIVNGTSLGMKPEDAPLLPAGSLLSRHLVFDMVYRAGGQLTQLGTLARQAGASYVDGVTLLLHQGAISFEHWFDRPAPLDVMRAGLQEALCA
ncbi:MAG: shikimate dehydrogenase [Verrucomicrobiaceae bacterium]|nr:shikimate dehydrogenase [Verrucomicrobiaceae bacterium]